MFDWHLGAIVAVAARTAIVYVMLLALIRISGKRQIGQMTPFDLVVLLLISNAVQNAMTGPDTTVSGGLVAAVSLVMLNWLVSRVRLRSSRFRRFVEGIPVVLVAHGMYEYRALQHESMTVDELMAVLREHEVENVAQVELAMLEVDGTVSVIRVDPNKPGHLLKTRKRLIHHHRPAQ